MRVLAYPHTVEQVDGQHLLMFAYVYGATNYQWQYRYKYNTAWNNCGGNGYNTPYYSPTITCTSTRRQYEYRCVVTDGTETINLGPASAVLITSTSSIISQPTDVLAQVGDYVVFNCRAVGLNVYQWQFSSDGTTWENVSSTGHYGAQYDTLVIPTITSSHLTYKYRCYLKNSANNNEMYTNEVQIKTTTSETDLLTTVYKATERWYGSASYGTNGASTGVIKAGKTSDGSKSFRARQTFSAPSPRSAIKSITLRLANGSGSSSTASLRIGCSTSSSWDATFDSCKDFTSIDMSETDHYFDLTSLADSVSAYTDTWYIHIIPYTSTNDRQAVFTATQNYMWIQIECYNGIMYYYDGTNWIKCFAYYHDGTQWKKCVPYYYTNSTWTKV